MEDKTGNNSSPNTADIGAMFDTIAGRYDFLNHFLSLGIDRRWRKKAIRIIGAHKKNPEILDVATGTGDLAISAMRIDPVKIKGIDISLKMLEIGEQKIRKLGLSDVIELLPGDSQSIPFPAGSFDVAMVAFGVRNFSDPLKGLGEMHRILRSGGLILVLEFSKPRRFPVRDIYNFYFRRILPLVGRLVSGDKKAYTYLPESVGRFPDNQEFIDLLGKAGFTGTSQVKLTGGIASIYTGFK